MKKAFFHSEKLLHLVNADGFAPELDSPEVISSVQAAEEVAERMLGCTLVVRDKSFIISSLEIYYGGIGDHAHDWYRTQFRHRVKHANANKGHSKTQEQQGLKIYLNIKGESRYKRMDIVVGPEGVAISFLIRNVMDSKGHNLAPKRGGPNRILKQMGIRDADQGKDLLNNGEILFLDTHEKYFKEMSLTVEKTKRVISSRPVGFQDERFGQYDWNFTLKKP